MKKTLFIILSAMALTLMQTPVLADNENEGAATVTDQKETVQQDGTGSTEQAPAPETAETAPDSASVKESEPVVNSQPTVAVEEKKDSPAKGEPVKESQSSIDSQSTATAPVAAEESRETVADVAPAQKKSQPAVDSQPPAPVPAAQNASRGSGTTQVSTQKTSPQKTAPASPYYNLRPVSPQEYNPYPGK